MTSVRTLRAVLALLLLSSITSVMKADCLVSDNGTEVRAVHNSCYLSELGLKVDELPWGKSVRGIRMAALSIPSKERDVNNLVYSTVVFSIQNQSGTPLVIPVVNALPHYYCYSSRDKSRKLLFTYAGPFSIEGPNLLTLNPGRMITFTMNNPRILLDKDNKEHVPMVFSVDFKGEFGEVLPDSEKDLVLESQEVKYPY